MLGGTPVGHLADVQGTSRRRLRQDDTLALRAVRITQACGDGCLLTFSHIDQARANASATISSAMYQSPVLASTTLKHLSR